MYKPEESKIIRTGLAEMMDAKKRANQQPYRRKDVRRCSIVTDEGQETTDKEQAR